MSEPENKPIDIKQSIKMNSLNKSKQRNDSIGTPESPFKILIHNLIKKFKKKEND